MQHWAVLRWVDDPICLHKFGMSSAVCRHVWAVVSILLTKIQVARMLPWRIYFESKLPSTLATHVVIGDLHL